ncbi:hypothetical protein [Staphylococcus saprophyticus]|uniref:hypothetical protein n=1 Tax=Staphylococcus saprophyticus TaxID=29385 RepID=UPI0028A34235|nr:hypothetical protein [Staphylococcus saprophyticus]MDT3924924.1 hypothetical protein [Staphylococcus saprophyticus]
MKLEVKFLGEKGQVFGRDENLLTNLGIDDISKKEAIRQEIEDYLAEHDEIKVVTGVKTENNIKTKNVKTVNISEDYLRGQTFSIDVTWN